MTVLLHGLNIGDLETVECRLRLIGEENGFSLYEPAQMYLQLKSGTTIEIVREVGYHIDEQGNVLTYDGPWSLATS